MTDPPFSRVVSELRRSDADGIDEVIRSAVPRVAPAVTISVWRSGVPYYEAYAGWTEPGRPANPVGAGTLFDLASLTKLYTATAFLRLVHDGRVGLDDAVISVIPEFGASGPRRVDGGQEPLTRRVLPVPPERRHWSIDPDTVTFRQLLTHTSGLAPWRAVFRETGPPPPAPGTPDEVPARERRMAALAAISRYGFVGRPGGEVAYSDLGYMLLGESVARLAGVPLGSALADLVGALSPRSTVTFRPIDAGRARVDIAPTSVDTDWRHRRCWGEVEDENAAGIGGVAGHAGLFAAVGDVARFGAAWCDGDARRRLGALGAAAVADQTGGMGVARGHGWLVQPADLLAPFGASAFGHTGFTGTSLVVDPDREIVVALLTNRVYARRVHEGIDQLRVAVHRSVAEAVRPAPRA